MDPSTEDVFSNKGDPLQDMTKNRSFDLRRAITSCLGKTYSLSATPREWTDALTNESGKISSAEIAFVLIESPKHEKSIVGTAARIAELYAWTRKSITAPHILKQFDHKMQSILNDVCKEIVDDSASASTALEVIHVFYTTVYSYKSSASNALLDMLSTVAIPPENNGHKRLKTLMKKTKNHHLVSASIRNGGFDIDLVNEAFLKSPSLRILFITLFKEEDDVNNVPVADSVSIRNLLGLAEREYDDTFQMGSDLETIMDFLLDDVSYESPDAKKKSVEEAETPPRKKPCIVEKTHQQDQHDVLPTQHLVNLTDISSNNNSITSYFKIKRGRVTEAHHKRSMDPVTDMLYCNEMPIGN